MSNQAIKEHGGNPKCTLLTKRRQSKKATTYYDSKSVIFWKGKTMETVKDQRLLEIGRRG